MRIYLAFVENRGAPGSDMAYSVQTPSIALGGFWSLKVLTGDPVF